MIYRLSHLIPGLVNRWSRKTQNLRRPWDAFESAAQMQRRSYLAYDSILIDFVFERICDYLKPYMKVLNFDSTINLVFSLFVNDKRFLQFKSLLPNFLILKSWHPSEFYHLFDFVLSSSTWFLAMFIFLRPFWWQHDLFVSMHLLLGVVVLRLSLYFILANFFIPIIILESFFLFFEFLWVGLSCLLLKITARVSK